MENLNEEIEHFCIRISQNGNSLGSGLLIYGGTNPEFKFVLTARHCISHLSGEEEISIDTFDYEYQRFKNHPLKKGDYSLLLDKNEKIELSLIRIEKHALEVKISNLELRLRPSKGITYNFIGFPKIYQNDRPEELRISLVTKLGSTYRFTSLDPLEENNNSASSNVKGFSGSVVFKRKNGKDEISAIITHFSAGFQRFHACSLESLPGLLKTHGLPSWNILEPEEDLNIDSTTTSSYAYYEFANKLFEDAERLIEQLRPRQALQIADSALDQIQKHNLPIQDRNDLLARLYWIQGLAKSYIDNDRDVYNLFINAYKLNPNHPNYKERAAISYLKTNNQANALKIAEEIIDVDDENPALG